MILLVANSLDFATDYVVRHLLHSGHSYYRLDLDLIHADTIWLDPVAQRLDVTGTHSRVVIENTADLRILYRAPTYLRESSGSRYSADELLQRHQWAAFARSLSIFTRATWINHPQAVYQAENKPYQLLMAKKVGFDVPRTWVANAPPPVSLSTPVALKALDSFLVRLDDQDAFFYTQRVAPTDVSELSLRAMPVILQDYLEAKLDIRVTVVGTRCVAASISASGMPIEGDWRLAKASAEFRLFDLPMEVQQACIRLVRELGLAFGAIDLALVDKTFYFLEINPTGEWAWLVDQLECPLDRMLADELSAQQN
jgi:hypothetical protein